MNFRDAMAKVEAERDTHEYLSHDWWEWDDVLEHMRGRLNWVEAEPEQKQRGSEIDYAETNR